MVELLVGTALSAAVMAAVLSSYVYLAQNLARLANQQSLETQARLTLGYFTRDVQMASGISGTPSVNSVTLTVPSASGTNTICYYYNQYPTPILVTVSGNSINMPPNTLTRCVYDGSSVSTLSILRLRNINNTTVSNRNDVTFRYYDSSGNEYSNYTDYISGIKKLRLEFSAANGNDPNDLSTAQTATSQYVSSILILRNRTSLQ